MIVKELITQLLECDMNKEVTVEYPTERGDIVGNYSRYNDTREFEIKEYEHGVIIGIEEL